MHATILDSRVDGESECFLCRITLEDYISGLPSTYQDYDVQREIVTNVYLDHLVDTVIGRKHIPPIVLVVDDGALTRQKSQLQISTFKILDGLQRTFRLKAIRETLRYCSEHIDTSEDILGWSKFKFSRKFSEDLRKLNSNTDVLRSVLEGLRSLGESGILETFTANGQWFEVWTGLSADEEVRKMLTLNAGHKPVKTRHQLELLFLNLLPILKAGEGASFNIVREREVSSTQFSKNRESGSFHFAHIISALLSLYAAKPVVPNATLIQGNQASETGIEEYGDLINPEFLKDFVAFLVRTDKAINAQYGEIGMLWMGREVALARGLRCNWLGRGNTDVARQSLMKRFTEIIRAHPTILNLEQFEVVRNNLDLSKVNIGNVNRSAIFSATKTLLVQNNASKVEWRKHFAGEV